MAESQDILVGKGKVEDTLLLRLANRHGLVAGATGTGKTVTLQVMAEGFSRAGVPVFAADVKGDLSGIAFSRGFERPVQPVDNRSRHVLWTDQPVRRGIDQIVTQTLRGRHARQPVHRLRIEGK